MRQPYSVIGAFGGNWLQWRRKRPEPPKWHPPCKHLPCRTTANSAGAQLLQLGWYVAHKAYLEACLALDLVLVSSAGNSTCAFNISFGCLSSKYSLHSKELSLPCCLFSWFGWVFFLFFPSLPWCIKYPVEVCWSLQSSAKNPVYFLPSLCYHSVKILIQ